MAEVTRLRREGLRLKFAEVSQPVRGILEFTDDDGHHTSFKRPMRIANLYEEVGVQRTRRDLLTPLAEAEVIRVEGPVLTIVGTELKSEPGTYRVREYRQVWRCAIPLRP
jgi:hypothetical protein